MKQARNIVQATLKSGERRGYMNQSDQNVATVQEIKHAPEVSAPKTLSQMTWREIYHEINGVNAFFLVVTPLLSVILLPIYMYHHGWSWGLTAFLVVLYTVSNLS